LGIRCVKELFSGKKVLDDGIRFLAKENQVPAANDQ
jgi:hypothetical protein